MYFSEAAKAIASMPPGNCLGALRSSSKKEKMPSCPSPFKNEAYRPACYISPPMWETTCWWPFFLSYQCFTVTVHIRAQFHGSAYRLILRLRSRFPAYVQAPNFCASLVSVEYLHVVMWITHAQKPKFAANPWNTLAVSREFPASVSADSMLTVSRAMQMGPDIDNSDEVLLPWSIRPVHVVQHLYSKKYSYFFPGTNAFLIKVLFGSFMFSFPWPLFYIYHLIFL